MSGDIATTQTPLEWTYPASSLCSPHSVGSSIGTCIKAARTYAHANTHPYTQAASTRSAWWAGSGTHRQPAPALRSSAYPHPHTPEYLGERQHSQRLSGLRLRKGSPSARVHGAHRDSGRMLRSPSPLAALRQFFLGRRLHLILPAMWQFV